MMFLWDIGRLICRHSLTFNCLVEQSKVPTSICLNFASCWSDTYPIFFPHIYGVHSLAYFDGPRLLSLGVHIPRIFDRRVRTNSASQLNHCFFQLSSRVFTLHFRMVCNQHMLIFYEDFVGWLLKIIVCIQTSFHEITRCENSKHETKLNGKLHWFYSWRTINRRTPPFFTPQSGNLTFSSRPRPLFSILTEHNGHDGQFHCWLARYTRVAGERTLVVVFIYFEWILWCHGDVVRNVVVGGWTWHVLVFHYLLRFFSFVLLDKDGYWMNNYFAFLFSACVEGKISRDKCHFPTRGSSKYLQQDLILS